MIHEQNFRFEQRKEMPRDISSSANNYSLYDKKDSLKDESSLNKFNEIKPCKTFNQ